MNYTEIFLLNYQKKIWLGFNYDAMLFLTLIKSIVLLIILLSFQIQ